MIPAPSNDSPVLSVRLYGSAFRGETDELSDIDVLVVYSREPKAFEREQVRATIGSGLGSNADIAEYESTRIRQLFEQGHLFAWHLLLESSTLVSHEDRFFDSLPSPLPYTSSIEDAKSFQDLATSALASLKSNQSSPVFEAGILFVAARNFSMSLTARTHGRPVFARDAPFLLGAALPEFPLSHTEYGALVRSRRASTKGTTPPDLNLASLIVQADKVNIWMARTLEIVEQDAYDTLSKHVL